MANNFIRAGGERHKSFKALIMKSQESLGKWYLWDWCQEMRQECGLRRGGVKFWYGKGYEKGKLVVFGLLIGYDVHVSENL